MKNLNDSIRSVVKYLSNKGIDIATFAYTSDGIKYKRSDDIFDFLSSMFSMYYYPDTLVIHLLGKFMLLTSLNTDPLNYVLGYYLPPDDIITKVKQVHKLYFGNKSPYFKKEYKRLLQEFSLSSVREPKAFLYVVYYDRRLIIVYRVDVYNITEKDIDKMSAQLEALRTKYSQYLYSQVEHLLVPQSDVDKVIADYMVSKVLSKLKLLLLDKMDEFNVDGIKRYELPP